jgi:hypothetical protein
MEKLRTAHLLQESAEALERQERDLHHVREKLAIHEGYFRLLLTVQDAHRGGMTDRCQSHAGHLACQLEKKARELMIEHDFEEKNKPAVARSPRSNGSWIRPGRASRKR